MKRIVCLLTCLALFLTLLSAADASGFTQNGDAIEEAAKSVLKLFI